MSDHPVTGEHHITLERMPYDPVAWDAIVAGYDDAEVFHTAAWLSFLTATQRAEPVVAVVRADGRPVGHFVGAIVRRYGVRILGSPLRGWTTQCMGFLLEEGIDRRAAAQALLPFAFRELGCLHVELADRKLSVDHMTGAGYDIESGRTFVIDLAEPEDAILSRMDGRARTYVRRAARRELRVERATGIDFAEEYYAQLVDVFGRQGLSPTYGVERVRRLIEAVQPTGQLLLLRVVTPSGQSVATSITVGRKETCVLWGTAFLRHHSDLHPNEPLHWETMRCWRPAGTLRYDMGGGGDYKAKYGGIETVTAHFYRSRWSALRYGRSAVRRLARARQVFGGWRHFHGRAGNPDPDG